MMFLDCPAYLDDEGGARCGLPAEIGCRYTMQSTDGPLDSVMIKCPTGHRFNGPVEFLTLMNGEGQPESAPDLWTRGALGGTRTPNLLIRSQMLYPLSYERQC
jgi:hypothetical protein